MRRRRGDRSISEKVGCTAETLRKWVRRAERDAGRRPVLKTEDARRLKELEREVRELQRANEIRTQPSEILLSTCPRFLTGSRRG